MFRMEKIPNVWAHRALIVGLLILPSTGRSQHAFKSLPDMLDREWVSSRVLPAVFLSDSSLSDSPEERYIKLRDHFQNRGLHPLFNIVAKPSDFEARFGYDLAGSTGLHIREYALRVGAYEVCKATLRTVDSPNGASHVLGVMPNVDSVYPHSDDSWSSTDEAVDMATSSLRATTQSSSSYTVTSMSRCLYPMSGELTPAWKIVMRDGPVPYQIYVGPLGVIEGDVMMFDATAAVRAYQYSSRDPDAKKRRW